MIFFCHTAWVIVWPAGLCTFSTRGLEPVCPSAIMGLPNRSLCLNDRPFICVSGLSSDTTLMALTSCKLRQLAVWECEPACMRGRVSALDQRGSCPYLHGGWSSNPCLFCFSTRGECPTRMHTAHLQPHTLAHVRPEKGCSAASVEKKG